MIKVFYILLFTMLLPFTWFHMVVIWQNYNDAPKWFRYIVDKTGF